MGRMKRCLTFNVICRNVALLNRFLIHGSTMQRGCAFRLALAAGLVLMDAANQLEADL
jgi:hypothetical protein